MNTVHLYGEITYFDTEAAGFTFFILLFKTWFVVFSSLVRYLMQNIKLYLYRLPIFEISLKIKAISVYADQRNRNQSPV